MNGSAEAGESDFFALVSAARAPTYKKLLSEQFAVRYFTNVSELLNACFESPPRAIIIDMPTSARLGEETSRLYNLEVSWPLLRSSPLAKGDANVLSIEPAYKGTLSHALESLMNNDRVWNHPRFVRKDLRLAWPSRVRVKVANEDRWRLANSTEIGMLGLTAVCYDPPDPGAEIEIELRDIGGAAYQCRGTVNWRQCWEESPNPPAMGAALYDVTAAMKDALLKLFRDDPALIY